MNFIFNPLTADFDYAGSGTFYPQVDYFADLPQAATYIGIYVVLYSSGIYLINRKEAGLYYSNGSSWTRLGDIPSFFNSANFEIYDAVDSSKKIKFILTPLSTLRNITVPDRSFQLDKIYKTLTDTDISNNKLFTSDGSKVQELGIGYGLSISGSDLINTNPSPTSPAGNNMNVQFNDNGVFGGAEFFNYDPSTGTTTAGAVNEARTQWESDGWQSMVKKARPWKEARCHLKDPTEGGFRWVDRGLGGIRGAGYYEISADEFSSNFIHFSFEMPHDYEEGSEYEIHVHWSNTEEIKEREETIAWRIAYTWANVHDQDSPDVDTDNFAYNGEYIVEARNTVFALPAWVHMKTEIECEGVIIKGSGKKISHWIQGTVKVDERVTTYTGKVAFLGIDIHYITDTLGSRSVREKGTIVGTPLKDPIIIEGGIGK